MESSNNSNTYVKGIIGDLENCRTILLYRSTSLLTLSITNMDFVLDNLKKNGNYVKLNKIEGKDYYLFNRLDENNNIRYTGFDTIIYLDHLDLPIGFTKFNVVKGLISDNLKIKTDFDTVIGRTEASNSDNLGLLNVEYSLDNVTEFISLSKKLINDNLNGYSTSKDLNKQLSEVKLKHSFTNNINEVIVDHNKLIALNYGMINNEGLFRLDIIKEMTIADGFTNIQLGYYRGEIIAYLWNIKEVSGGVEINYIINSLSRKDLFGNPITYTRKGSFSTINIYDVNVANVKINYFSGRYLSVTVGSNSVVYDIIEEVMVCLDNEYPNHVIDLWGNGRIIELPSVLSRKNLVEFIPETRNLHIDIKNYKQTIHLEKIIGEWYVFKETRSSSRKTNAIFENFLIYTNFTKTIIISEKYDNEPIIINNNILALRTTELLDNKKYDYYTYFVGDGNFISENANMIMDRLNNESRNKKYFNSDFGCLVYDENNYEYYKNNSLIIDRIGSNFLDSYLFGFRRSECPEDIKVPEIIGAISGLVYYKLENKIKLL